VTHGRRSGAAAPATHAAVLGHPGDFRDGRLRTKATTAATSMGWAEFTSTKGQPPATGWPTSSFQSSSTSRSPSNCPAWRIPARARYRSCATDFGQQQKTRQLPRADPQDSYRRRTDRSCSRSPHQSESRQQRALRQQRASRQQRRVQQVRPPAATRYRRLNDSAARTPRSRLGTTVIPPTPAVLGDLFDLSLTQQADAWWFRARLADHPESRAVAIELIAISIADRLCKASSCAFANWVSRYNGGQEHDEASKAELQAYLLADFADGSNVTRFSGAVAEHLWANLAGHLEGGWGTPLHVEHDHFSVIDHGGDGVSIYEFAAPDLRFRLWESKRHASERTTVTTVVTGAAGQLKRDGPSYLARLSKPLQLHDDPRVQQLAGTIVKLWTTQDPRGGVGVSVGTTPTTLPGRPFKGLREAFEHLPDPASCEGLIIEIDSFDDFSAGVRAAILRGID
jgi:hypothetical protein